MQGQIACPFFSKAVRSPCLIPLLAFEGMSYAVTFCTVRLESTSLS